jgi:hypothetical protein
VLFSQVRAEIRPRRIPRQHNPASPANMLNIPMEFLHNDEVATHLNPAV